MTNDHRGARYYDLAHGNPISDTDTNSDSWGGLEGRSPSISAQPSGQGRGAATDDLQREAARLESVRQAAGRLEEDVEKLEAIASLADKFDHAGRFEKRGILDEIAARCDGLRGRVEQVVEGIRGAVGRLEMAIADLSRKLAPRSARMTTRALKRDLAALEKDMSPVTLASEARDAARAYNARRGNVPQRDRGQSR